MRREEEFTLVLDRYELGVVAMELGTVLNQDLFLLTPIVRLELLFIELAEIRLRDLRHLNLNVWELDDLFTTLL
jgi:hypothetical protein